MELIRVDPRNIEIPKGYIPTYHKRNTCDAIKYTGVMLPIVVKKEGERLVLIDGLERLECAKRLGWREVEALVVDKENMDILRLALNYVRGKVCGIDVLTYTHQMVASYGQTALAIILGRSADTVNKYYRAMNHLISIGLTGEDIDKLRSQCVPIRRILQCAFDIHDREEFWQCLEKRPKKSFKDIPPEVVSTVQKIMQDPQKQEVVDLVAYYGPERFQQVLEVLNVIHLSICPRVDGLFGKVDADIYNAFRKVCELLKA